MLLTGTSLFRGSSLGMVVTAFSGHSESPMNHGASVAVSKREPFACAGMPCNSDPSRLYLHCHDRDTQLKLSGAAAVVQRPLGVVTHILTYPTIIMSRLGSSSTMMFAKATKFGVLNAKPSAID
eukprot:scaffold2220_cov377-Prasinococcus_capsulatus_cf.AAC.7